MIECGRDCPEAKRVKAERSDKLCAYLAVQLTNSLGLDMIADSLGTVTPVLLRSIRLELQVATDTDEQKELISNLKSLAEGYKQQADDCPFLTGEGEPVLIPDVDVRVAVAECQPQAS